MSRRAAERERLLAEGRAMLRALGAPEGSEPGVVEGLRRFVGRSRAGDLALAERLGQLASAASLELLDELETRAADRVVRREARRARYRLGQRGIASPAPPAVRVVPRAAEPEGWMSAVSGNGERLLWLVSRSAGGGFRQLMGMVNDLAGLLHAELFDTSAKRLRQLRDDLAAKHHLRLVPVPWRYADFALWEGYERARSAAAGSVDLPRLRSRVVHADPIPVPHPLYDHIDAEALGGAAGEAEAAALWEEPEMSDWLLDWESVRPFVEELEAAEQSPLVLTRFQQQDRVESVFARAISSLLGDSGARYRRRLEDMGYYFWQTGRPQAARRAGAVAVELAEHPASEVAFLQILVRVSVASALEHRLQAEADRERGSLVVPPDRFKLPGPFRREPDPA